MHAGIECERDINHKAGSIIPASKAISATCTFRVLPASPTFCRILMMRQLLSPGKLELIFLFFIQQKRIQFFSFLSSVAVLCYHILQLVGTKCLSYCCSPRSLVLHIRHLYLQTCYQVIHSFCDRQAHGHQRTVQVTHERIIGTALAISFVPARQHRVVLHNQVLHSHLSSIPILGEALSSSSYPASIRFIYCAILS